VAEDMTEAVRLAMQDTSIDMSMNPPLATGFFESLIRLVRSSFCIFRVDFGDGCNHISK